MSYESGLQYLSETGQLSKRVGSVCLIVAVHHPVTGGEICDYYNALYPENPLARNELAKRISDAKALKLIEAKSYRTDSKTGITVEEYGPPNVVPIKLQKPKSPKEIQSELLAGLQMVRDFLEGDTTLNREELLEHVTYLLEENL